MSELSNSVLRTSEVNKAIEIIAEAILTKNPTPDGINEFKAAAAMLREEGEPALVGIRNLSREETIDAVEKILHDIKKGMYRI